ncbi:hypothetical protein [Actinomadura rupiterrae]|uniref:hypothetical protein n=1 Tax=Actinomadura rupiterrae TaxID=559627 RepID=UPI0020A5D085|nr:hypothetical protein [Actinomadura rupiterrae]MCP2337197.1 hypothetical protein [Actinomadura rupiterrae]
MSAPRHWLDPVRCPACARLNPSWLAYRPDRDGDRVTCESCNAVVLVLLADGRLVELRPLNPANTTGGDA